MTKTEGIRVATPARGIKGADTPSIGNPVRADTIRTSARSNATGFGKAAKPPEGQLADALKKRAARGPHDTSSKDRPDAARVIRQPNGKLIEEKLRYIAARGGVTGFRKVPHSVTRDKSDSPPKVSKDKERGLEALIREFKEGKKAPHTDGKYDRGKPDGNGRYAGPKEVPPIGSADFRQWQIDRRNGLVPLSPGSKFYYA